jgi:AraC family transcriptional regulator
MSEPTDKPEMRSPAVRLTPSDIVSRRFTAWNGVQMDSVRAVRREPFEYGAHSDRHLLIMTERAERDDGETLVEGLPISTRHKFSRKLSFVPAGHQFFGWQKPHVLTRVTYFYVDPNGPLLDPELRFSEIEFKPRLFFSHEGLWDIVAKLKSQCDKSGPGQQQYTDALTILLGHELLRLNDGPGVTQRPLRGGLASWQEKKVSEFIESHLLDGIPLAVLADLAHLSPFHFVRAFKQSFGLPPHRYLVKLRIDRAKALLADSAMSVTQVGARLGFSETSSFTTTFRKFAGFTPTAYRRGLR